MAGIRTRRHFRRFFSILLLSAAVAAAAQTAAWAQAKPAPGLLYDEATLVRASAALRAGELRKALSLYCAMLRPPRQGELWTVSVVLLCDAADVASVAAQIETPAPVFVQAREFGGRQCYRICAGLTTDRARASRWVTLLPDSMKPQGPFPVRVMFPCDGAAASEPAPSAQPAPPPKAPPGPGAGRDFLGPPVKVPPEPPGPAPAEPDARSSAGPGKTAAPSAKQDAEAEGWFRNGLEAYQQGRRLDAYECYDRALTLEPDRPEILNNLGVLYLEERRFAQAQPLFEKAVRLSPAYAAAHLNLAGALWGLKRFDDAIQEAREAAVLDSSNVNAYLTLASFFLARDRKDEAAQAAKHALALDPKSERAQVFLQAAQAPREAPETRR